MKTTEAAILVGALALFLTAFDFGIAQAAGNQSEQPVLSFEEMAALQQGSPSSAYVESRPVLGFDYEEDYRLAKSPAEGMQLQNPAETGSLPSGTATESSIIEAGGVNYRVGIDTN